MANILEEKLREAVSIGDVDSVNTLLSQKVNVNSQNSVNGCNFFRTALHWAYKRENKHLIKLLVDHGAKQDVRNSQGQTPNEVSPDLNSKDKSSNGGLHIIPNYLKNPSSSVDLGTAQKKQKTADYKKVTVKEEEVSSPSLKEEDVLVIPVRIADLEDQDYIDIEIPKSNLTYANLLRVCCQELKVRQNQVERIRKRPCTRLRNDNDVKRLEKYNNLEIVLKPEFYAD
uniref:Ankyrin repeat domain-containing protein 40-like isoform X1 n=1 Tax=Diabrotica virgifera virgifera TaxID=50390 RepID=A0A6P7F1G9_DIAVI